MSTPTVTSGNLYLFNNLMEHIEQLREVHFCRDLLEQIPSVKGRIAAMEARGHKVEYSRVTFKGGVGSYKFMIRRKKFRLQIAANVHGIDRNRITAGLYSIVKRKRKKYLTYAYCIEI